MTQTYNHNSMDGAGNVLRYANSKGILIQHYNSGFYMSPRPVGWQPDLSGVENIRISEDFDFVSVPGVKTVEAAIKIFMETYRDRKYATKNSKGRGPELSRQPNPIPLHITSDPEPVASTAKEEISAMATAYDALRQLDKGAQRRALGWLCSKLNFEQ